MLLGCGVVIALLVFLVITSVKWHDAQLSQLQNELSTISHPINSSLLAEHGEIANFGNGNHLDYWAVQLRSITGPRNTLKTAYTNVRVPVPNSGTDPSQEVSNGKQPIAWDLLPSPLPAHFQLRVGNSNEWDLSRFAGQWGLYTVQIINSGENDSIATFFDWRGN